MVGLFALGRGKPLINLGSAQADVVGAIERQRLCRRPVAAQTVRREMEFNINMSARSLGLADNDSPVVVQGVIDCCFMENGRWVLLDYKTDFVPPGVRANEAALKHARQVSLYAEALARLTGIPVAGRMIFFFALGEAAAVPEDAP